MPGTFVSLCSKFGAGRGVCGIMKKILSAKAGVRMEQMIISGEHPTGIYLAILDEKGEMEAAKVIGAM